MADIYSPFLEKEKILNAIRTIIDKRAVDCYNHCGSLEPDACAECFLQKLWCAYFECNKTHCDDSCQDKILEVISSFAKEDDLDQ